MNTKQVDLQEILSEWQNNLKFREAFNKNPRAAISANQWEVSDSDLEKAESMLNIDKSSNEKLDSRENK